MVSSLALSANEWNASRMNLVDECEAPVHGWKVRWMNAWLWVPGWISGWMDVWVGGWGEGDRSCIFDVAAKTVCVCVCVLEESPVLASWCLLACLLACLRTHHGKRAIPAQINVPMVVQSRGYSWGIGIRAEIRCYLRKKEFVAVLAGWETRSRGRVRELAPVRTTQSLQ